MAVEDPTKKQIEEVDPEVAKILGLEDNFDLEYDEYMTLLKERMVKGAFEGEEKLSEEDLAKIANERKRIRGLEGSKFTAPKKTVDVDSFFGRKKEESSTGQKPITDAAKLLPGSGGAIQKYKPPEEEPQEEKKDNTADKLKEVENFLSGTLLGIVKEIRGLTEDILSVLQKQGAADKKGSEVSRRESEKGGKRSKEKDLEKKEEKKGLGLVEKIAKPFTSIFDTIKNFILMVLLGSAVNFLWSVFKNPMILLKPIQGLIDGITGFFNTVIQFIDKMVVQPVRSFIDSINSALNGFIGLLNNALKMLPGSPQIGPANIPNIPQAPELQAPNITGEPKQQQQPQAQPKVQLQFTGGPIRPETPVLKMNTAGAVSQPREKKNPFDDTASREGGIVNSKTTAFDVSGLGPDKFLTALSLGEYILKPGAVQWLGGETYLNSVNKMFGGSEQRRTANLGDIKIESKSTGGPIGPSSSATPASSSPASGSSTPASTSKDINPDGSFKVDNKIFSPTKYVKDTRDTKYIKIGNPLKSYVLKYQRQGASGNITVKQVNKLVSGAGATVLFGNKDNLTGVLPSSPEGRLVINSANLVNYFRTAQNHAVAESIPLNIKYDNDSDIYYWYNQAYQTHYNDWMKQGVGPGTASHYAAYAAAEFAISKSSKGSKGSWMPGSKLGAPEALKTQAVEADLANPDSTTPSSDDTSTTKPRLSASDLSFSIKGDAAKQSYIDNLSKTNKSSGSSPSVQPTTPLVQGSQPKAKEKDPVGPAPAKPAAPSAPSAPSAPAAPAAPGASGVTLDSYGRDPTKLPSKEQREAAANARQQALLLGFVKGSPQYEKMVAEATMKASSSASPGMISPATLSPATISSTPKPLIPEPPQSKSPITTLPLPQLQQKGSSNKSGMTKTASTPEVYFSSSNGSESSIVTTASLYNIWGM